MRYPDSETVKRIRREYPQGTRIELVEMDDPQSPPPGTRGTVLYVDDTGTIFPKWDSGGGLGLVYGKDKYREITE